MDMYLLRQLGSHYGTASTLVLWLEEYNYQRSITPISVAQNTSGYMTNHCVVCVALTFIPCNIRIRRQLPCMRDNDKRP